MKKIAQLTMVSFLISLSSLAFADREGPKASTEGYEIGLSMYSLRDLFRSGELHVLDYPAFAKEKFGITKIDVWEDGFPEDKKRDPEFYKALKEKADAAGSEIFLVMAGSVDAEPDDSAILWDNGQKYSYAVDNAEVLGAKYVRIFLRVDERVSKDIAVQKSIIALTPLANHALSKGIVLAIEPGGSERTRLGSFLAKVVTEFDHPSCKLMPDFGKMRGTDVYEGTVDMMPHTVVVSAKTHKFAKDGSETEFDYPQLMKSLHDSDFTGIVAIEYEGKKLDPVEGVRATQRILKANNK